PSSSRSPPWGGCDRPRRGIRRGGAGTAGGNRVPKNSRQRSARLPRCREFEARPPRIKYRRQVGKPARLDRGVGPPLIDPERSLGAVTARGGVPVRRWSGG